MELPEGTHLTTTLEQANELRKTIANVEGVSSITSFIGRGVPRFFYNLNPNPNSPHIAQFIV